MSVRPAPLGVISSIIQEWHEVTQEGHEVASEPEIMGALSGSRFRRSDREQVVLPLETAIALKEFEAGLREAGFIAHNQALFQKPEGETVFTVQTVDVSVDLGHCVSSVEKRGHRAEALSAELFSQEPLVKGQRNRLANEMCIVRRSRWRRNAPT